MSTVVVDGLSTFEIAAVDKVVLSNGELDVGSEYRLDVVHEGETTVFGGLSGAAAVVDVSEVAVVIVISDGSASTTVDSDGDDNEVVVEKGIFGDAFDGSIVGVATSMTWMSCLNWTTRWTLASTETTAGSERVTM